MIDAQVVRVIDGDTIRLSFEVNARLDFINAPETRGRERIEGLAVKEWLQKKLEEGDKVQVDIKKFDMYDRPLIVAYKDGENINGTMLTLKLVEVYSPGVVGDGKTEAL